MFLKVRKEILLKISQDTMLVLNFKTLARYPSLSEV